MKLRYKLPLYYTIIWIICILAFWYIANNSKTLIIWFIQNNFNESTKSITQQVDLFMDEKINDINTLSKNWIINKYVNKKETQSLQSELYNYILINNSFNYIEIINNEWSIIWRSDLVRRDNTKYFYIIENESLKQIWKTNTEIKNIDNNIIYISDIIKNEFNQKSINIIVKKDKFTIKWNLKIDFIENIVKNNSLWNKSLFKIQNNISNDILTIENTIIENSDKSFFISKNKTKYNDWIISIKQSRSQAYKNLYSLFYSFIGLIIFIILAIIFLITVIYKNFSNPLSKLIKTVKEIAECDDIECSYDTDLDLTRNDEIWFLAKSFHKMLWNIRWNIKILNEYKWLIDESSLVSKCDKNWKITYVNDRFCEISDYTRKQLIWKNTSIIRHPDMSNEIFDDLWNTVNVKKIWKWVIKYKKKTWEAYWASMTVAPILDLKNNIIEYISIWNDITELEKTKQELKDSYNKLQDSTTKLIEKERIWKEFELAEQIQNDFLPKLNEINIEWLQVHFWVKAATEIWGDLYDVINQKSDPNKVLLYIWDVTWHWLISWMMMAVCNTLVYSLANQYNNMVDILTNLNSTLFNKLPNKVFITMLMLQYDIKTWTFCYLWAWHEKILIYRKKLDKIEEMKSWWDALWMFKTTKKNIEPNKLILSSWDIVLLYTDWITEARNKKWDFYWIEKFKDSFKSNSHRKIDALYTSMKKDLIDYTQWTELLDDITMFIIKKD